MRYIASNPTALKLNRATLLELPHLASVLEEKANGLQGQRKQQARTNGESADTLFYHHYEVFTESVLEYIARSTDSCAFPSKNGRWGEWEREGRLVKESIKKTLILLIIAQDNIDDIDQKLKDGGQKAMFSIIDGQGGIGNRGNKNSIILSPGNIHPNITTGIYSNREAGYRQRSACLASMIYLGISQISRECWCRCRRLFSAEMDTKEGKDRLLVHPSGSMLWGERTDVSVHWYHVRHTDTTACSTGDFLEGSVSLVVRWFVVLFLCVLYIWFHAVDGQDPGWAGTHGGSVRTYVHGMFSVVSGGWIPDGEADLCTEHVLRVFTVFKQLHSCYCAVSSV